MSVLDQELSGLSRAINLRAYRHQVLASNIANADTPGYKARDFDFQTVFQNATAGIPGDGGLVLQTTSERHIGASSGSGLPGLQYRTDVQSAVDGNTVDMDTERTQIADNSMQYEILTRLITDRLQGIRAALASSQG